MTKTILLSFALLITALLQAQKVNVGIHGAAVLPANTYTLTEGQRLLNTIPSNITPGNGIGLGLSANYRFKFGLELGFSGGYVQFAEQYYEDSFLIFTANQTSVSAKAIPVQFKAEYYFLKGRVHPYAGCGAGYMFYESDIVTAQLLGGDAQIKLSDQHGFFVSPRAGAQFNLTTYLAIDVGFAYNLGLNGSENVDAVLLLDENQVNFVPGTTAEATNTYSINLGVMFTILEND